MGHGPEKWSAWLDAHGPALILLARQWADSHAEAEDIVQDAFVRFWPNRASARSARAYLHACVRSAATDRRRREARRRRREQAAEPARESLFDSPIEQGERRDAVERALTALPREQREVVIMKIWGQLTFQGIGEATGAPANTAASRYRYALASLREALQQERVG